MEAFRPFSCEDWRVTALEAKKELVLESPVVCVTVGPANPGYGAVPNSPLIDVPVPGSPPLLPGDIAGATRVVAWQEQMVTLLQPYSSLLTQSKVHVTLDFIVEPERFMTSDLDNFCVPTVQGVGLGIFGNPALASRVTSLRATKVRSRKELPPGARIRIAAL